MPRLLATLAAVALAVPPARAADVLVLRDGRRVEVDSWWTQGDQVMYRKYGGTVGIPRSTIEQVLPGDDGSDERPAPAPRVDGYAAGGGGAASDGAALATISPDLPGEVGTDSLERQLRALEDLSRREPAERAEASRRMAALLTLMGNERLRGGDPDAAVDAYERAAGLDPALVAAQVNLAAALLEQGRNREALGHLDAALALDPDQPDAWFYRGEALYRDEQVPEAIRAWERAETLAPSERTRACIEKASREQAVGGDYRASAGAHFTLRYDGARSDPALGDAILAFLEDRFTALVSRYNALPESVIVVILYPKEEFHEVTQTPQWTGGLYDGKIRVPVGGVRSLDDPLRRVLVHELTHALVAAKSRGNAPTWAQEGLAQIEEGRSPSRRVTLELARAYRLQGGDGFGEALDYASSLAFTTYLIDRHGFGAMLDFLDRLGHGASEAEAFGGAFGTSYAAAARDWGASLQEDPS